MTNDLDLALVTLRVSRDHGHGAVLNDAEVRALLAEIDRDDLRAECEALKEALAELVACKALKDAGLRSPEDEDAYFRRKPAAWAAARAALAQIEQERSEQEANGGHGHVRPRIDGVKARCGGPAMCAVCAREQAQMLAQVNSAKDM